jgi:hypothetical protein
MVARHKASTEITHLLQLTIKNLTEYSKSKATYFLPAGISRDGENCQSSFRSIKTQRYFGWVEQRSGRTRAKASL